MSTTDTAATADDWARLTFGIRSFHGTANPTAGGLVTTGPYRYIRHPVLRGHPPIGVLFGGMAAGIAAGTVTGRYHFVSEVIAGGAVATIVFLFAQWAGSW